MGDFIRQGNVPISMRVLTRMRLVKQKTGISIKSQVEQGFALLEKRSNRSRKRD